MPGSSTSSNETGIVDAFLKSSTLLGQGLEPMFPRGPGGVFRRYRSARRRRQPGEPGAGFPGCRSRPGNRQPLNRQDAAATADFMRRFSQSVLSGALPSVALREAAKHMRKNPATAHPYYWAAFQLYGYK